MATPVLKSSDVFDLNQLTALPAFGHDGCSMADQSVLTATVGDGFTRFCHPQAGLIALKCLSLPYVHILDLRWQTKATVRLLNTLALNTISTRFIVNGSMESRIDGSSETVSMRPQTHHFIHTPEVNYINQLPSGQFLSMLILELDTQFFSQCIGQDDAWSEQITTDLFHAGPFYGAHNAQTITPRMQWLIDEIRNSPATGPVRTLLIQSRVLELIALQLEQFRGAVSALPVTLPDETEKLHRLKAYLEANFLKEHSLAQLSRYCALNEFKVKRGFKQLFNTTVFDYLRKLRMDYAGQLLRSGTLSVEEISDQLGYAHGHHFAAAFRKYTGLNPSQYQRGE